MNILLIGGTVFLGRHIVEAAQARGHSLTLFNRGQHNPDLFPDVEKIHGDRASDLTLLAGRRWDAVIDTCGYVPRVVRISAEALADVTDHYTFVSSLSVYAEPIAPNTDESGALATMADPTQEEITGESYGPLKALCEAAAEEAMPGRVLVVRPGLIVGPHDPTDRFTYWPERIADGGEVLVPASPERRIQYIDVRDLAEWIVRAVEAKRVGSYNTNGPDSHLPMRRLVEACREASGSDARFTWVDEAFLEGKAAAWSELPVWAGEESDPKMAGFFAFNVAKAVAAGLTFRSVEETVRDTLAWNKTRPADAPRRAGLARQREAEILREWHDSQK